MISEVATLPTVSAYLSVTKAEGFWFCLKCHVSWHQHHYGGDMYSVGKPEHEEGRDNHPTENLR